MNENELEVTKSEQFGTYRQIITPKSQEAVSQIFSVLLTIYRANRITGPILINFNQGGVRNIVADQVAKVPEGSEADKALEILFGK